MIISFCFIIIIIVLGGTVEGFDASARPLSLALALPCFLGNLFIFFKPTSCYKQS